MERYDAPSGEALLALATLAAIQLGQGKTAEQLTVLAAFLTVLADSLALLAARRSDEADPSGSVAAVL